MFNRLKEIADLEKIKIEDDALKEIVYLADGGMRDALSLLDQIAFDNDDITYDVVVKNLGIISNKKVRELIDAVFNNNVIDIDHFAKPDAGESEKAVYESFVSKNDNVIEELRSEFYEKLTPYEKLTKEYQWYMSHIAAMLYSDGLLDSSKVDREDSMYIAWTTDETISLAEYLKYAISMNWIDVSKLSIDNQYADSEEIFSQIVSSVIIFSILKSHGHSSPLKVS